MHFKAVHARKLLGAMKISRLILFFQLSVIARPVSSELENELTTRKQRFYYLGFLLFPDI